jgi:hypothetical protein
MTGGWGTPRRLGGVPEGPKVRDVSLVLRVNGVAKVDKTRDDLLEAARAAFGLAATRGWSQWAVTHVMLCEQDDEVADKVAAEHQPVVAKIHSTAISCTCGMPDADWRSSHEADAAFDFTMHVMAMAGWEVSDG